MTTQVKPEQALRIDEALRSGAYGSRDEVIERALDVLHEQDEWPHDFGFGEPER
jgi:Arc/MetJ-type ribon-helix-helix transcriptional regulator